eukprot:515202_1
MFFVCVTSALNGWHLFEQFVWSISQSVGTHVASVRDTWLVFVRHILKVHIISNEYQFGTILFLRLWHDFNISRNQWQSMAINGNQIDEIINAIKPKLPMHAIKHKLRGHSRINLIGWVNGDGPTNSIK